MSPFTFQPATPERWSDLEQLFGKTAPMPAAGACSGGRSGVAPREDLLALENSRILKRVDHQPVWSITCFFVAREAREKGLMEPLLRAAVKHAWSQGAKIVEAYPIDMQSPRLMGQKLNSYSGYMGIASAFRSAGFVEVGRASETQLIMRLDRKAAGK